MPWEKKGPADRTLVFDTFVAVGRHNPLVVNWPGAALTPDDGLVLRRLTENLTTLGRAEGWVHAESVESLTAEWNCAPAAAAETDQELVSVFCPDPATAFGDEHYPPRPDAKKLKKGLKPDEHLFDCPRWHLCLDTEIIHGERWPQVPGARWVSYARPADAFTRKAVRIDQPPAGRHLNTVARFLLDGPVLPLVTDTVRVAEAFRRAVMGGYQRWHHRRKYGTAEAPYREPFRSEVLSGKDSSGRYLPGHDHAHYLPTAEGDDRRRLTHLTVWARRGLDEGETAALSGLRRLAVGELRLRAQLVGLGRPGDFRAEVLSGPARVWSSATPYIGPAHVGRTGRDRYLRKALRREVRRWASEQSVEVRVEAVEALPEGSPAWSGRPRPLEFIRVRRRADDDGYRRPFGTFRLTLSAPIDGPLCLGYACHYGLGLFLPCI